MDKLDLCLDSASKKLLKEASDMAKQYRSLFITPEHFLLAFFSQKKKIANYEGFFGFSVEDAISQTKEYITKYNEDAMIDEYTPILSFNMQYTLAFGISMNDVNNVATIIYKISRLNDCYAANILNQTKLDKSRFAALHKVLYGKELKEEDLKQMYLSIEIFGLVAKAQGAEKGLKHHENVESIVKSSKILSYGKELCVSNPKKSAFFGGSIHVFVKYFDLDNVAFEYYVTENEEVWVLKDAETKESYAIFVGKVAKDIGTADLMLEDIVINADPTYGYCAKYENDDIQDHEEEDFVNDDDYNKSRATELHTIDDCILDLDNIGEMFSEYSDESGEYFQIEPISPYVAKLADSARNPKVLIGREKEVERVLQIFCRRDKHNVILIGEPGVGKSALAFGIANLFERQEVPEPLRKYRVYSIDMGDLYAGAEYRGEYEKRIRTVIDSILETGSGILFVDGIHELIKAGSNKDSMSAGSVLKKYIEDENMLIFGTTTFEDYNKICTSHKDILRYFHQVEVKEPSTDEAVQILEGLKGLYENYHNVVFSEGAMRHAVKVSSEVIKDRRLPDKAIDLIDEAAASFRYSSNNDKQGIVDEKTIDKVVSNVSKIRAKALLNDFEDQLKTLKPRILDRLYGQDDAVSKVVEAVELAKAGLQDENKPMASLLFVGPTGVGKTELCKVLAEELGVELVRFDMSEYSDKYTVSSLIGSTSGYVGYEEGGLLTNAIRQNPNCVLLLDEVEKAHPDVFNILLQVMDYATLTDGRGVKSDFSRVILIMTSNCGAQYARQASLGFGARPSMGTAMLSEVKRLFKPEFINRLTGIVPFNDMDKNMAQLVLNRKILELSKKMSLKNVTLDVSDDAKEFLLHKGYSKEYGAREIERVMREYVLLPLTHEILYGSLRGGGIACIVPEASDGMERSKLKVELKKA